LWPTSLPSPLTTSLDISFTKWFLRLPNKRKINESGIQHGNGTDFGGRVSADELSHRRMGIANVWVIDPGNRVGYDCSTAAWLPVEEFRVVGTTIFFRLSDLWGELEMNR